jgi:hypothetical protein
VSLTRSRRLPRCCSRSLAPRDVQDDVPAELLEVDEILWTPHPA